MESQARKALPASDMTADEDEPFLSKEFSVWGFRAKMKLIITKQCADKKGLCTSYFGILIHCVTGLGYCRYGVGLTVWCIGAWGLELRD